MVTVPYGTPMKAWLFLILGILAILTGAVWTLQGLGYLEGSPMTGEPLWVVLGPLLALFGLWLTVTGARRLRRP